MSRARHSVLIDLSILTSETRVRGIGRYVGDLGRELARVDPGDLTLRFLEHVGWDGDVVIKDDADEAIAGALGREEISASTWRKRMRIHSGRAMRASGARLFHQPHGFITPLGFEGTRLVTCHDLIPLLYPQHYLSWKSGWSVGRRLLDRRRYLSADHILAISQATAASLERVLAIDRSHITVVHLGIDASAFHPDGAEPEPPPRPYFLYVGDGDWRKNGAGMLSALALARREVECELVWAGRLREKYRDALKKQERALGMDGALRLLGYVDDAALGAYYRGAMATLFVSYEEGFGYPVLEAMASGCPVITSNVSCLPEVAGDAALLVSPSEPRAIADAMLALLRDAGARDDLRRRGLAHVQRFSSRAMATKTLDVYRKLVA